MQRYRKNKLLLFCVFLCLLFGIFSLIVFYFSDLPKPDARINLSYSITVHNPTNRVVENAAIGVRVPIQKTAFQKRNRIDTNFPYASEMLFKKQDAPVFRWEVFPPLTTKVITIRSELDCWKKPRKSEVLDLTMFLQPQPLIESDNAKIVALANQLKADSIPKTIRRTFSWVSKNIVYAGYIRTPRGALYALHYKKGDCTEFAYLFVALCRANRIPARVVGGFVCPNSAVLDLGAYHEWAEFYHQGRWYVADPQRHQLMSDQHIYIAFQIVDPGNIQDAIVDSSKAKDLQIKLNKI